VVKKVNEKHTCPASIREAMSDRARRVMGRKVEATKRSMKGRGKLRKQRKPKAAPDSGAEEEDETDPYPTSSELAEEVENLRKVRFSFSFSPFLSCFPLSLDLLTRILLDTFTEWCLTLSSARSTVQHCSGSLHSPPRFRSTTRFHDLAPIDNHEPASGRVGMLPRSEPSQEFEWRSLHFRNQDEEETRTLVVHWSYW
jgi:hypothetical protein